MGLIYQNGILYSGSGGGGGTGDVADVYVNGQSVLDANKIAQIKSYKEVTQAEYDALPVSKESDDVLYCITDQATADTTVAPIIYSEEEREIGVWIDGKPLYQKTIIQHNTDVTGTFINVDVSALNIDNCVSIKGICDRIVPNVGILIYEFNSFENSTYNTYIAYSKFNNVIQYKIQFNSSGGESTSFQIFTLQYTKTTDQPGSGKYAPSGVPAVHYSENEQVVGTWVDGSTIYERTFNVEYLTSSTKSIAHGINNLGHIVQIYGYVTNNTYNFPMPYVTTDAASCIGITVDATNINIISINRNDYYGYVTIRYTKTTS